MDPVTAMIGAWVGEFATVEITKAVLSGVSSKLNPNDIDSSVKAGVKEAYSQESRLFYRCQPDFIPKFLNNFFKTQGLAELQKPLLNKGKPDVAFLAAAFKEAAKSDPKMKDIDELFVQPWMEVFVGTYFRHTETYLRFQVAKENYLQQLANWFDDVKFAGVAVAGQEIEKSEKLAHIFVMPDVQEDVKAPDYIIDTEFLDGVSQRQQELFLEQRQRSLFNNSGKQFLASQLLTESSSHSCVLLGAPGSGKTTLLSYFAVMLATKQAERLGLSKDIDYLPILIRMRDLARQGDISILDYGRQFAEKSMCVKSLPTGFFEYWLEDGRALILLDGLDEVVQETKRYEVVQRIENFLSQFKGNRAIITSRPAGYKRSFFRTEEFPHYELLAFDDEKVEEFINHWYDSRIQDKQEAETRKDSLRKALDDNDRIKLLARNPLLLTIIALIHRYQAALPKERYKLYDKAVETLLTSWDANKELSNHTVLQYLKLDDLQRLMERLAYWIHTQGSTGDKEGGTLIDCDELLEKLKLEIKVFTGIELYKAEEEARRFLALIRERTGLLNEQGQGCYAFVHKTFQEYMCAQEINYQADNEGDFNIILEHIRSNLHNPYWREVLLLLVSQQKPKKAAKAIRAILNSNSEYEKWLHRDLFFATSCLTEDPKNLNAEDKALAVEILEKLVELEISSIDIVGRKIKEQVFETLCRFSETSFETLALQMLRATGDKIDIVRLQQYRAQFGEREKAIDVLLELLDDEERTVRDAAEALGRLDILDLQVVKYYLDSTRSPIKKKRIQAANALTKWGKKTWYVDKLLSELEHEYSEVREISVEALGYCDKSDDSIISGLLTRLQDKDSRVRKKAFEALGKLINTSELVVNKLLDLLKNEDTEIQESAISSLGTLGENSQIILDKVLQVVDYIKINFNSVFIRALKNFNKYSEIVVHISINSLLNRQQYSSTTLDVGYLGIDAPEIINKLSTILNNKNENIQERFSAVESLYAMRKESEDSVNLAMQLLQHETTQLRMRSAAILAEFSNHIEEPLKVVIPLLDHNDRLISNRAATALGNLMKKSEKAVQVAVKWLDENENSPYAGKVIDALYNFIVD